jgi:hypothetical protein
MMLARGRRPVLLGGALVAACAWDIAVHWPRIVVPDAPANYRFDFALGLDWLVLSRPGHDRARVDAVVDALLGAGAHVVAPVVLPVFVDDTSTVRANP